jgi:hypothetical protein
VRPKLRYFWEYFKLVYANWWTAAYLSIIGAYDLIRRAIPPSVWAMPDLAPQALWWLALPLLFLAPFPVFLSLRSRLDESEKKIRHLTINAQQTASRTLLDLRFGEASRLAPATRMDMAQARLDELEREILSGDFSHFGEVLALHEILLSLFREYYGAAGLHYVQLRERLGVMIQLMLERDLCLPSDLLAPVPPGHDPISGRIRRPPA